MKTKRKQITNREQLLDCVCDMIESHMFTTAVIFYRFHKARLIKKGKWK